MADFSIFTEFSIWLQKQNKIAKIENSKSKNRNRKLEIEKSKLKTRNRKLEIENSKAKTRNRKLEIEIENSKSKTGNRKLEIENSKSKTRNRKLEIENSKPKTRNRRASKSQLNFLCLNYDRFYFFCLCFLIWGVVAGSSGIGMHFHEITRFPRWSAIPRDRKN